MCYMTVSPAYRVIFRKLAQSFRFELSAVSMIFNCCGCYYGCSDAVISYDKEYVAFLADVPLEINEWLYGENVVPSGKQALPNSYS